MSAVIGIDPSLASTGLAFVNGSTSRVRPGDRVGVERLDFIASTVREVLFLQMPELVVIEGYSFGSAGRGVVQMGEVGGALRLELHRAGVRWIALPPPTVKKYATGKGNSGKPEMLISARDRLGYEGFNDDEADALWLRAAGRELLGDPVVQRTKLQRSALKDHWEAFGIEGEVA